MYIEQLESKYPTKRYIKLERVIKEKLKGGYYHIPEAISSPDCAFDTIMGIANLEEETQEVFGILALNTKNKVVGFDIIHRGSLNASIVHPRDVFKSLLLKNAASFMCFHNHPSGDPQPSREDINVTERLVEAGKIIGIDMLDHIITGDEGKYVSLKEKGYL
jgi:DNA repair protein RadC